ncbi:putative phage tail fiber protein [Bergeriella denitrificans]|uniref:Putative phage tail fiber protein n=2 Tax=Bergeriella denitrificans TaxID=494 RepID=A0A378UFL6_BERDE|nr:tail fiber protein [Bergeriella denitrificans]STZ76117.1 putative phage tail fiber protein [Bergeriella denitrificans]
MANLVETNRWEAGIYQFETSDPVMGGPNGIDNRPTRELANRTLWLKTELAKAVQGIGNNKTAADNTYAKKNTALSAGAGLTGGGTLGSNVSFSLGTPSDLTENSTSVAVSNTHSHKLPRASTSVRGIVKTNNTLTGTASDEALSAAMGKELKELIDDVSGDSFKLRGEIPANRNLNDLTATAANIGVWHQAANARSTAANNYPVQLAGTLFVLPAVAGGTQVYIPYNNSGIWTRPQTSGSSGWNAWTRLGDDKLGNSGNQTLANGVLNIQRNAWEKLRFTNSDGSFWRLETEPVGSNADGARFNLVFNGAGGTNEIGRVAFPRVAGGETAAYQSWVQQFVNAQIAASDPQNRTGVDLDTTVTPTFFRNATAAAGLPTTGDYGGLVLGHASDCTQILAEAGRLWVRGNDNNPITGAEGWSVWDRLAREQDVMMLNGNQTVAGVKTFTSAPVMAGLTVNRSDGRTAALGIGGSDTYLMNKTSNKTLQLKDNGSLEYSNDKIMLYSDRSDAVNLNDTAKLATSRAVKTAYDKAVAAENAALQAAPSGAIMYYEGDTAPPGWLKANGAAVSRKTYAKLFAIFGTRYGAGNGTTTFNLPDRRGEFLRGWDDGRGVDAGRALGSAQADAFQGHARNLKRSESNARMHGLNYHQVVAMNSSDMSPAPAVVDQGDNWHTHDYLPHLNYGTPRVAAETRPRNIALLAIIKI